MLVEPPVGFNFLSLPAVVVYDCDAMNVVSCSVLKIQVGSVVFVYKIINFFSSSFNLQWSSDALSGRGDSCLNRYVRHN